MLITKSETSKPKGIIKASQPIEVEHRQIDKAPRRLHRLLLLLI